MSVRKSFIKSLLELAKIEKKIVGLKNFEKSVEKPYWVVMTKDVLPGSIGKLYEDQNEMVEDLRLPFRFTYSVPQVLEAVTVIIAH